MGYEARWSGEVRITPPLTWAEIRDSRCPGFQDLKLRLDEKVEDTPTGQIKTVTADAVVPMTQEPFNGYSIDAELQALVDAHGASHTIEGRIETDGPEGNHWAYVVHGGQVEYIQPRLVWPGEDGDAALPCRGDAVEQWLKAQRDAAADYPEAYQSADGLLDLYRLHADTGTPLDEHVCEGKAVGDCGCLEQGEAGEPRA